jgi:hypothetical protein
VPAWSDWSRSLSYLTGVDADATDFNGLKSYCKKIAGREKSQEFRSCRIKSELSSEISRFNEDVLFVDAKNATMSLATTY